MHKTRISQNALTNNYQSNGAHHNKRIFHNKNIHSNSERSQRHTLNSRHHPATKRISKMNQHSPAKVRIKSTSKSSKSQIPPPILTSTFQLQSYADNYVNIPKVKI